MASIGAPATLVELFASRAALEPDRTAQYVRRDGQYTPQSWRQFADEVAHAAAAFARLGVAPGDRVAQIAENSHPWILTDLAVHANRGVHVAMHATLTGEQLAYQIRDCGARLVVLSGPHQAAKLAGMADQLPGELEYVSYEPCPEPVGRRQVRLLDDILKIAAPQLGHELWRQAVSKVAPNDLATILYTSGTTGEPKGVMLSHGNLTSNAVGSFAAFGGEPDDLRICWLPLSHIYARTSDLYTWLACGSEFALAGSRETILDDCAQLHPTLINGVPYFYDKLMRLLVDRGKADEPGALRALFGGRMRVCCAGGAALATHVAEFFAQRGVPLVQGYGLTESSPVITTGTLACNRIGTVGLPIPGVEVRIAPDGEILTRGPHVMLGYWNKPEATAEVLRDGWLHTGDLGELDDGYLRITGRKKELIVTAGGKNIAPVYLESLLCADSLFAQAMIVGDARNYLVALIVPDHDRLNAALATAGEQLPEANGRLAHPAVRALYAERIARQLAGVSPAEQVRNFALLPRPLSIEQGELTPTLKLRRGVVAEHFADVIEGLYRAGGDTAPAC